MSDVAISVENLTRDYDSLRAVDHLSFDVGTGEIFGFLGPNGAGKTTTVRMLTTILGPTEGTATIFGYDICRQSYQARLHFGVIPEESNIYTELSAWENLMFSARLYRIKKRQAKTHAEELLRMFDLWEKRDDKTGGFSRGMRRKVTIAMSLIHRPRLLFLDEATSGLDVQSTRSIWGLLQQLNERGTSIFLTTHRMEEANALCHRVAIINHGRLAAVDTPINLRAVTKQLQSVEVHMEPLEQKDVEALANHPAVVRAHRMGAALRLYTSDPIAVVRGVLRYADENGKALAHVGSSGAGLEDVFLYLTEGVEAVGSSTESSKDRKQSRKGGKGQ